MSDLLADHRHGLLHHGLSGNLMHQRRPLALTHRTRRRHLITGSLSNRHRRLSNLSRSTVINCQLLQSETLTHKRLQRLRPRGSSRSRRRLSNIAHNRERLHRATTHQQTPLHGRELLSLIHHNMAIRPRTISRSRSRRGHPLATDLIHHRNLLRSNHAISANILQRLVNILQRLRSVLKVRTMLRRSTSRSRSTGHLRKIAQKLSSLIQQRNISLGEGSIRRTSQQLTLSLRQLTGCRLQVMRLREQRAQQSLRRQRHPRQVQGAAHIH